jgi:hypothetical protein
MNEKLLHNLGNIYIAINNSQFYLKFLQNLLNYAKGLFLQ